MLYDEVSFSKFLEIVQTNIIRYCVIVIALGQWRYQI